jgi:Flp pilus assembly protein TadB
MGRRRPSRFAARDDAVLPLIVDLYVAAARSGATVPLATVAIAPRLPGEVGLAWHRAADRLVGGDPAAEALLGIVDDLGPHMRPLVDALVADVRYGAPLAAALERLAEQQRVEQRFALEARVRRAPVAMLLPLTLCVLPAFVLLAIVPLVVGALQGLGAH